MDTNLIFRCSTREVEHKNIKFVSASGHVIFCLIHKQQYQGYFSNFPKISEDFPKIFENSPNTVLSSYEHLRSFSENFRRLPKISEQASKMFRSYRNQNLGSFNHASNFVNLVAHTTSLLSSHVNISNLSSYVKISCFYSKRNPCNIIRNYIYALTA